MIVLRETSPNAVFSSPVFEYTLAPLEKRARVVLFIVVIDVVLDAMSVSFELMLDALVVMLEALDAMSVSLELILVLLLLMLDSTSVRSPSASVPEIVASSENVAAPVTANVLLAVTAPVRVVAPVTVAVPSKVASPSTLKSLRVVTVPEVFLDLIDQKKSHHIKDCLIELEI